MLNLHLADHFLLAVGLNSCSGTRNGQACSLTCLGHYSLSSAGDENQLLLSLPLLPTVRKVVSGEVVSEPNQERVEFSIYGTGSVFLDDSFETVDVFALVVQDRMDGDVIICLLPSLQDCLLELARVLPSPGSASRLTAPARRETECLPSGAPGHI